MRGHGWYPPGIVPSTLCHPAWDTSSHTVGAQTHPERVARALVGRGHGPVPQFCPHPTAWPSPSAFPHCPRGSRELGGLPWGQAAALCLQAAQAGTSWGGHRDTREKQAAPGAEMAARDDVLAKGGEGDYCSIGPTSGAVSAHGDLGFKGFFYRDSEAPRLLVHRLGVLPWDHAHWGEGTCPGHGAGHHQASGPSLLAPRWPRAQVVAVPPAPQ